MSALLCLPQPPQVIMRSPGVVTQPYVNDHMAMSVVSTLLCCWLIGIFAILKSLKVRQVSTVTLTSVSHLPPSPLLNMDVISSILLRPMSN